MSNLDKVLSSLPALSREDLDVVVATAQALARGRPRAGNRRGGGKAPSKKGPKQTKSPYDGEPLHERFKLSERVLHDYLKKVGKKLSDVAPQGSKTPGIAEPVSAFFEARDRWFREKAAIKDAAPEGKTSSSSQVQQSVAGPKAPHAAASQARSAAPPTPGSPART